MKLTKYKLGDVASFEVSNIDKKSKEGEKAVKLCNFTDVYSNWAITDSMKNKFMEASASDSQIEKFSLKKGQVAITKDSETRDDIGIPTYIADDFKDVVLGYHCALITPDLTKVDGKYMNAFLNSKVAKKYFENNAVGSGMRFSLTLDTINDILLYLPSLKDQKEIGNLFSLIDKKISLNQEINRNLEALARQLYDYWFIQFDFPDENERPYKSSGGKMVWNEKLKREIPEGWSETTLGDFCEMYQPQTLATEDLNKNEKYWVYGANGIIGKYHDYNHATSEIAMACRGNSCGVVNRTLQESWITGNAMVIKPKNNIQNEFILRTIPYINIKGAISGSGQPQLTRENLSTVLLCRPSLEILKKYSISVEPSVQLFLQNLREINDLMYMRDNLLPLLMSGQISVKQIEVNCDLSI